MITLLLAAVLLVQDAPTREEILRLARAGEKEAVILARLGNATFKLSADDVVELKKAGVSEKVIARMIEGPRELKIVNKAHRGISVAVREKTIVIDVGGAGEVQPGTTVQLAAAGEYAVVKNGREMPWTIKTPATLTFRGADITQAEVITFQVEAGSESSTHILEVRDKTDLLPEPRLLRPLPAPPPHFERHGTLLPHMLIGAGIGAIIGHQSGHRTQGALIGAGAGAIFDCLR